MSTAGVTEVDRIADTIAETPWVDTHEHLLEPATRRRGPGAHDLQPCTDFALLFYHYSVDDLTSAGMPEAVRHRLYAPETSVAEKWELLRPWWERCRHTGYLRAVAQTLRVLFGVDPDHLDADVLGRVSAEMTERAERTTHYRDVFDRAGVLTCQVNTLEAGLFKESGEPDLLLQDLGLGVLSTGLDVAAMTRRSGRTVRDLADWHGVIDWAFDTYGPRAVAVKSAAAYQRRLDYAPVDEDTAAPLLARHLRGDALEPDERKALEDHLFRYCLARASERGLPIKLHCGHFAGTGWMPLARVKENAADVCALLHDFPDGRFVLMHIGWPYAEEYISIAKQYPNAWVDLCWAWILAPMTTARFVREYLTAAPANKLLCFGGDYTTVENVVGHAVVARQGLGLALRGLVADGWMGEDGARALVPGLMGDNARTLFRLDAQGRLSR